MSVKSREREQQRNPGMPVFMAEKQDREAFKRLKAEQKKAEDELMSRISGISGESGEKQADPSETE